MAYLGDVQTGLPHASSKRATCLQKYLKVINQQSIPTLTDSELLYQCHQLKASKLLLLQHGLTWLAAPMPGIQNLPAQICRHVWHLVLMKLTAVAAVGVSFCGCTWW